MLDPVDHGATRPSSAPQSQDVLTDIPSDSDAIEDRFEAARAGLADLLPRVGTHGHLDALERLVSLTPEDFGVTNERQGGTVSTDTLAAVVLTPERSEDTGGHIDVDVLLPGLADHAARMARLYGKSATVSFGAVGAYLPAAMTDEWRAAVATALLAICEATLERPRDRRARGLSGTSHIELSARGVEMPSGASAVELRIACPGMVHPSLDVEAPHTVSTHAEAGRVVLVFTAQADSAVHSGTAA